MEFSLFKSVVYCSLWLRIWYAATIITKTKTNTDPIRTVTRPKMCWWFCSFLFCFSKESVSKRRKKNNNKIIPNTPNEFLFIIIEAQHLALDTHLIYILLKPFCAVFFLQYLLYILFCSGVDVHFFLFNVVRFFYLEPNNKCNCFAIFIYGSAK